MSKITLGEKIRLIRKSLELNQLEFAKKLGFKSATAVSKFEDNSRNPKKNNLIEIAKMGNITLDELLIGIEFKEYPNANGPAGIKPIVNNSADGYVSSDEFMFIRQMRGKISAGGGLEPDDTVDLRIAFRKDWITHKGKPENMSLIKVDGDSMIPTLLNGDLVLVDHGKNYIASQGGIYAISVNHEIMIKRVQPVFPNGKLRVISDNKQYEAYEIESDKVKINGKIIWFARDMER